MARKPTVAPRVLDVCTIVQEGGSPCAAVNEAIGALDAGQDLVLRVPFEPRPLYAVMGRQGFGYESARLADGSWQVRFFPVGDVVKDGRKCAPGCGHANERRRWIPLDVRRLGAPERVAAALRAIGELGDEECLAVRSARKPSRLLSLLARRGCTYDCTEQRDHTYVTEIWREAGAAQPTRVGVSPQEKRHAR